MLYKISKKSFIKKTIKDIYGIKTSNLTYKGLSDHTIALNSNLSNVSQQSNLVLEAIGGVEPYVRPVLSINNKTSQLLNFSDRSLSLSASTYVYHFILINYSYNDEDASVGIVRYTVTGGKLESPTILSYGSVANYDLSKYNEDLYTYKQNHDNETLENFNKQQIPVLSETTRIGTNVIDAEVVTDGSGYTLGSTFYVDQPYRASNYVPALQNNKCTLNCKLCLCSNTIIITGGSGYLENDTFSVSSSEDAGEILVTEVDDNGSIVSTRISKRGLGFSATPTVTYNGSTGSSATIDINDNYSVAFNKNDYEYTSYMDDSVFDEGLYAEGGSTSIPLDSPYNILNTSGEAYTTDNYMIIAKNSLGEDYIPDDFAVVFITAENIDSDDIIIFAADDYDITGIHVEIPGNNLSTDNINLYLVNKDPINKLINLTQSNLITINDVFIDIDKPTRTGTITDSFRILTN